MKNTALYPGSFDPITNGHLDIIERSLKVFDQLIIVVASSSRKSSLLNPEERVALIQKAIGASKRISVQRWDGLIMEFAKKTGAKALVRGLRAASDFEYEFMMAGINRDLNPNVETVFMMTGENLFFISSSMMKELYQFGGDISAYVPKVVADYLNKKARSKK